MSFSAEDPTRWEPAIKAFEKQDQSNPPKPGGVLFVGSSSIRGWNLEKYFPKKNFINRGFGGSEISDSIHFADRIIIKHKPKTVFLYAGDNDIAKGKTPQQVFEDFQKFVKTVHGRLPKTHICFIAIKPSLKRWNLVDKMKAANTLIEQKCQGSKQFHYIDIFSPMLNKSGEPKKELFLADGLHLNHQGYLLWKKQVIPFIE